MAYNAMNRRVEKQSDSTTKFIWDFDNDSYLLETDESGLTLATYTGEPVMYGKLVSQERSGTPSFYHFDGQGSTRQLTDSLAGVTDEYTYTAFGETVASSGVTVNPFGYNGALGYYVNPETHNIYVRERVYAPEEGRWLSTDPTLYRRHQSGKFVSWNPFVFFTQWNVATLPNDTRRRETSNLRPTIIDEIPPADDLLRSTLCDTCGCLPGPDATGDCNIRFFVGHFGGAARRFLRANGNPNASIFTGCGNYVGAIACFNGRLNEQIPEDERIPRFPDFGADPLLATQVLGAVRKGWTDARNLAKRLCRNRRNFCDDGEPERYRCGQGNERCDTVTIEMTCDQDARRLLTQGIGPPPMNVQGVLMPTKETRAYCGKREVFECCEAEFRL